MGLVLLLVMIAVPLVEIAVFIQVGGWIGLVPTLATVVITAFIGTALLRHQGLSTLTKARESLALGRFPVSEVFDGLCLVFAGALLLTPGFVTDAVGFLLFVPVLRTILRQRLGHFLLASGRVQTWSDGQPQSRPGASGPTIIEGDYEVDDNDNDSDRRPRGSSR